MQGLVVEVKENKAVVLVKGGEIKEINNKNYKVGQKIELHFDSYKKYLQIAACFIMICFLGLGGYTAYSTPTDYIYVDINPSLRLDINCFGEVVAVNPLNDDASELIKKYEFKNRNTEACINDIVNACREQHYLNDENNDVELNVVTNRKSVDKKITKVSEKLKNDKVVVLVDKTTKKDNEKALNLKTSPKRLKAIEEYTNEFGGSIEDNIYNLREMTVKEIYAEIEPKEEIKVDENKQNSISAENKEKVKKKDENSITLNPSQKRLEAIEEYTNEFGGTIEENILLLREFSVKEIRNAINKKENLIY